MKAPSIPSFLYCSSVGGLRDYLEIKIKSFETERNRTALISVLIMASEAVLNTWTYTRAALFHSGREHKRGSSLSNEDSPSVVPELN